MGHAPRIEGRSLLEEGLGGDLKRGEGWGSG
jgi:hypothetical protein